MADDTKKKKKKDKAEKEDKGAKNPVLKSAIQDIVHHTASLGVFDSVRIRTADDGSILVDASDTGMSVIVMGRMKNSIPEFEGHYFGFGKLTHFASLLKLDNYAGEGGSIKIKTAKRKVKKYGGKETEVPESFVFADGHGNRDVVTLLDADLVDHVIGREPKDPKEQEWEVSITPDSTKVEQMMQAAAIYSSLEVKEFGVRTDGSDLVFELNSDKTGATGRRVFASDVEGKLETPRFWDTSSFLKVIKLAANRDGCTINFKADTPAMMIRIDSGVAVYDYFLIGKVPKKDDGE